MNEHTTTSGEFLSKTDVFPEQTDGYIETGKNTVGEH